MNDAPEMLDLVNENDQIIETILRGEISQSNSKGFVRAADAFIQNRHGQIWVPRRQAHKTIAPGGLDYSMGEHVQAGENYMQACLRGFAEELTCIFKNPN